jgi:hypothetical protein
LTSYDRTERKYLETSKTQLTNLLNTYVQNGKLGEAKKIQAALTSFLTAHEVALVLTRQQKARYKRTKVIAEEIPKTLQVYAMTDATGKVKGWTSPLKKARAKALVLCAFQSGVRPSCLVRLPYGLVKNHLYPKVSAPIPLKIMEALDTKITGYDLDYYYTFLGVEAAQALGQCLDLRGEADLVKRLGPHAHHGRRSQPRLLYRPA